MFLPCRPCCDGGGLGALTCADEGKSYVAQNNVYTLTLDARTTTRDLTVYVEPEVGYAYCFDLVIKDAADDSVLCSFLSQTAANGVDASYTCAVASTVSAVKVEWANVTGQLGASCGTSAAPSGFEMRWSFECPTEATTPSCFSHSSCSPTGENPASLEITFERDDATQDYYCLQVTVQEKDLFGTVVNTFDRSVSINMVDMEGTLAFASYGSGSPTGSPTTKSGYRYFDSSSCLGVAWTALYRYFGVSCALQAVPALLYDSDIGGGGGACLTCASTPGSGIYYLPTALNVATPSVGIYLRAPTALDFGAFGDTVCGPQTGLSIDMSLCAYEEYNGTLVTLKTAAQWVSASAPFDRYLIGENGVKQLFTGQPAGGGNRFEPVLASIVETGSPIMNITRVEAVW